ncbi:MAG: hypothetical protein RBU30_20020 [Polyangia bacterium]|nr:hypothetical protein [Polyangia bacterium]
MTPLVPSRRLSCKADPGKPDERCDNQEDDDGDGLSDCADPDCEGRACGQGLACASGVCG